MSKNLQITPLGGLGGIGKNMTVYEYGRNLIVVDCGVMFPDNDMYGIDLVLPDFEYVVENQDKLRGIVLTHGHMDHIGALPYLLQQLEAPIYGTRLTLGLVERQLAEKNLLDKADLRRACDRDKTAPIGPFQVSPFAVAHSIPDAVGLVIETPVGKIVHTGDYKLDETPAGGHKTDLASAARTDARRRAGHAGRQHQRRQTGAHRDRSRWCGRRWTGCLPEAKGQRIIIATFSSLLARLQEIMDLAQKHGRKVALTGRSLVENVELARELGYLEVPQGLIVDAPHEHRAGETGHSRDRLAGRAAFGAEPDGGREPSPGQGRAGRHDHHLRRHDPGQRGGRQPDDQQAL